MESFTAGEKVEAIYPGTDTFYPGNIHVVDPVQTTEDSLLVKLY